jgi:hypothetical protein
MSGDTVGSAVAQYEVATARDTDTNIRYTIPTNNIVYSPEKINETRRLVPGIAQSHLNNYTLGILGHETRHFAEKEFFRDKEYNQVYRYFSPESNTGQYPHFVNDQPDAQLNTEEQMAVESMIYRFGNVNR